MKLAAKIFNNQQTYIELGVQQIKLVQRTGNKVSYKRTFERVTDNFDFYFQHLKQSPQWVTLLIPAVNLFLQTLDLPREAEDRLGEIIKFQFADQLPCRQEEVYISYYLAHQSEQRIKVLAFAVLKDYLDQLYDLCQQVDVKVKAIVPLPLVYYLCYQQQFSSEQNILYLNPCLDYFNFTFLSKEQIYLRGSQTKDIHQTKAYLMQELDHSIDVIEETTVRPTDFWQKVEQAAAKIAEQEFIDLAPQLKQAAGKKIKIMTSLIIGLLIVNFILCGYLKRSKLEDVETKLNQVQPAVRQLKEFDEEITALRSRTKQISQEINWRDNYLPWLIELNTILGSEVAIEQLYLSENRLVLLSGQAPSAGAVMDCLEESAYFVNLNFGGPIETLAAGERFKIEGDLNNEVD